MAYFSRRVQLERFFPKLKYESFEVGEQRETLKDAIEAVEQGVHEYIEAKKAQLSETKKKIDNEEVPFSDTVAGVKMLRSDEFLGKNFENKSCVGCGKPKPNCSC